MEDRGGGWEEQAKPYEEEGEQGEKRAAATAEDAKTAVAVADTQPESDEKAAEREAEAPVVDTDWNFIDMETVSLHDLPHALIACNLPLAVFFADGPCRVGEPTGKASGWEKAGRGSCLSLECGGGWGGWSYVCACFGCLPARELTDQAERRIMASRERLKDRPDRRPGQPSAVADGPAGGEHLEGNTATAVDQEHCTVK